jgi:predicted AAA+ superfamily ATPase
MYKMPGMKYHSRSLESTIQSLCTHFPVVAVLGARQVGKSTLVKHLFGSEYEVVVFDPVQDIEQARAEPDLFLANHPGRLFLDEVQYAPELLASIKRRVDRSGEAGQFILSGSQNLAVIKNISESLAGRVAIVELHGLSFAEIKGTAASGRLLDWVDGAQRAGGGDQRSEISPQGGEPPPWYATIFRGGLPGTLALPDALLPRFFSSYLQTYVERDIRTVADIGNLQLFSRFFRLLGALSTTEINASQVGRDLDIDRRTAIAWKSVLESTYQWTEIPAFSRNPVKRVAGKSKGVFSDTGMLCHLQRITSPEMIASHPLQGRIIETWVITEILKICSVWNTMPGFYHYRSAGGAEVDLILELNGRLFPVEIKSKAHPSKKDAGGIKSFRQAFPNEDIADGLLVCAAAQPYRISEHVMAMPWHMLG